MNRILASNMMRRRPLKGRKTKSSAKERPAVFPSAARERDAVGRLIKAVVNRRSGAVLGREPEEIEANLSQLLATDGTEVQIACVAPEKLQDAIDEALDHPPDILMIGGGDGTVRAAASRLIDSPIILGILPLGTTNRMARDLGIPLGLEEAAQALASASEASIDVGEVNGRIFLCNSLLGLPIEVGRTRQIARGASLPVRLKAYAALLVTLFGATRKISIELEDGSDRRRVHALSIAIANNAYDDAPALVLARERLDGGVLAIYLSRHPHGRALGWALIRAMLGRWRDDPHVEEIKVEQATFRLKGRRIHICNDGEVEEMTAPLRYRIRPRSLRVLKPRPEWS